MQADRNIPAHAQRPLAWAHRVLLACACLAAALLGGCGAMQDYAPQPGQEPAAEQVHPRTPLPFSAEAEKSDRDFEAAWALVADGQFGRAESAWSDWLRRYGVADNSRTPDAIFWRGYSLEKLERFADAREQYAKLLREFPGTPAAHRAAQRLAQLPAE